MTPPANQTALPRIVFAANLWTLVEHPSAGAEWTLEEKFRAVKDAGFQAVNCKADAHTAGLLKKIGLRYSAGFEVEGEEDYARLIREQMDAGAENINVQLGLHDTPVAEATRLVLRLMEESDRQNANVHLETHRGRCTETPEKTYAIADAYLQVTGKLLRLNFDYSHWAVVKHLMSADFSRRLLERPDLLQYGNLIHCRPFNGHHCQIPITNGHGELTREFLEYLPFVEEVFRCWLAGPRPHNELWVVPELGPVSWGYGISIWPPAWEDAIVAMCEFQKIWNKIIGTPEQKISGYFAEMSAKLEKWKKGQYGPENFTPRAQQVLALARREADRFNHNFVGVEHVLLGLLMLGEGVAVELLKNKGLDLETGRRAVEKEVGPATHEKGQGNIPYTPRVKQVLVLAAKEAKALNHNYISVEHILLGMLREGSGVAGRVLKQFGVDYAVTREEIHTIVKASETSQ